VFQQCTQSVLQSVDPEQPATSEEEFRAFLATAMQRAATSPFPAGGVIRVDWSPAGWEEFAKAAGLAPVVPMISMETDSLSSPDGLRLT
jgi:hypothetical protein